MKRIILLLLAAIAAFTVSGQSSGSTVSIPEYLHQSPKAAAFQKYGNYPVSMYTGLVDITIPIYEININGIRVPIEFKYHAGGYRYDDIPMELGRGWTLMAGGTATETIRGQQNGYNWSSSELYNKHIDSITPGGSHNINWDESDNKRLDMIYKGSIMHNGLSYPISEDGYPYSDSYAYSLDPLDGELDFMTYSFLGNNASYYYHLMEFVPYKPWILNRGNVIDENGISYVFGHFDASRSFPNSPRGWTSHLTKIISADKRDSVVFEYTDLQSNFLGAPIYGSRRKEIETEYPGSYPVTQWEENNISPVYYNPPLLTTITYRGGKIEFSYGSGTRARALEYIKIYNNPSSTVPVKTVKVVQGNFNDEYLRLDAVEFYGEGVNISASSKLYDYTLGYNGNLPNDKGFDYWGFLNGAAQGITYNCTPNTIDPQGMDRNPNENAMLKGMLTKITYPTKGYTTFQYESNESIWSMSSGLRIKEMCNYDSDARLIDKKWYTYGTGKANLNIGDTFFSSTFKEIGMINPTFDPNDSIPSINIEIKPEDRIDYVKRIETYTPFSNRNSMISGNPVVYTSVTEYTGDDSSSNGRTQYYYTFYNDSLPENKTNRLVTAPYPLKSYSWRNGLLSGKQVYDKNGALIYSLSNDYGVINYNEHKNMNVRKEFVIIRHPSCSNEPSDCHINREFEDFTGSFNFASILDGSRFEYYYYYTTTGMNVLLSSEETIDGVTKTTRYSYNNLGQPIDIKVSTSYGDSLRTKIKYPYDLSSNPNLGLPKGIYDHMTYDFNIVSPVIEKVDSCGNDLLGRVRTDYTLKNGSYYPSVVKTDNQNGVLEPRIVYHNYDKYGNPVYITKDDETKVVYLWGYFGRYPVAEIKNADYETVAGYLSQSFVENLLEAADASPYLGVLDKLRGNPLFDGSLITTYTYKPEVGITSSTDPSGRKTTYEYGADGNLSRVYDHQGNVVSNYQYNYKQ